MPKVIVEFDLETGDSTMDAVGYTGKICEIRLANLMESLGATEIKHELKPEYTLRAKKEKAKKRRVRA